MKKLIFSAFLCITITFSAFSQMTEGHIQYDLAINMPEDDPSAEMMASMMEGSTLDIFFQNQNSRSEIQMGTLMKMVVVVEAKTGEMLTLMSGMFGKKALKANLNDEELAKGDPEGEYDIKFVDEKKSILGYECKKAILTSSSGEMLTAWYTNDFSVYKKGINFMQEQIPGAPLEFEMSMSGIAMKVTAKLVEKKIQGGNTLFDLSVPDGYEITTIEELQKIGGQ